MPKIKGTSKSVERINIKALIKKITWGAILISDKIDLKTKIVSRVKDFNNDKMIDSPGRHKHVYVPNSRALKYMKEKLTKLKGVINNETVIVGNINTLL